MSPLSPLEAELLAFMARAHDGYERVPNGSDSAAAPHRLRGLGLTRFVAPTQGGVADVVITDRGRLALRVHAVAALKGAVLS